jgi:hypothetical protein
MILVERISLKHLIVCGCCGIDNGSSEINYVKFFDTYFGNSTTVKLCDGCLNELADKIKDFKKEENNAPMLPLENL